MYYSNYTITVRRRNGLMDQETANELCTLFRDELDFCFDGVDDCEAQWYSEDETTWHSEEEDMRAISSDHPDLIFEVHRKGEDWDDVEDVYYCNGLQEEVFWIIRPGDATGIGRIFRGWEQPKKFEEELL